MNPIFDDLVAELGEDGDPFRAALAEPAIWHDWTDLIPPPSLNEVLGELVKGDWNQVTRAQELLNAEVMLRRIAAREDTQFDLPKVKEEVKGEH